MAHVFQTDFPAAECQVIASAVLSRTFSLGLVRDAWVVAEFAMVQVIPDNAVHPHLMGATISISETEAFEQLARASTTDGLLGAVPTLSWLVILKTILQLVINLIPSTPTPVPTPA